VSDKVFCPRFTVPYDTLREFLKHRARFIGLYLLRCQGIIKLHDLIITRLTECRVRILLVNNESERTWKEVVAA
jgi:hypothetical protein